MSSRPPRGTTDGVRPSDGGRSDDERFERAVRDALLRRAPGESHASLRARIHDIPAAEDPSGRWVLGSVGLRILAGLAAAAVVVVAAGILVATRPPLTGTVGEPSSPTAIPASGAPSTAPTPVASPAPTPPAGTAAAELTGAFPGGFWTVQGTKLSISADGGATWRTGSLPVSSPMAVGVLDARHAWVVYPVGATLTPVTGSASDVKQLFIYRTSDGGTTWDATKLTENLADTNQAIAFRDALHGYILAWPLRMGGGQATLLATRDGGVNWSVAGHGNWLGGEFAIGPDGSLWAGNPGEAGPEPRPLLDVSRDGGRTWQDAGLPGYVGAAGAQDTVLGPPAFFGSRGVVAVLDESALAQVLHVFVTSDAGATWTAAGTLSRSDVASYAVPMTFAAADATHWLVSGLGGSSLRVTMDAGRSWQDAPTSGLAGGFTALWFADATHGLAETTTPGALFVTSDGGRSWSPASPVPSSVSTATPSVGPSGWTGLRWSAPAVLPAGGATYATPGDVIAWDGGYVAVGSLQYGSQPIDAPAAWWSSDGRSWTLGYVGPREETASMGRLVALPRRLVALGTAGKQMCTAPGAGQTCQPLPVATWTSTDGRSWVRGPSVPSLAGASIVGLAVHDGRAIAVGDTGWTHPGVWSSTDGTTWTREPLPASAFAQAHFGELAAFAGGLVVGGGVGGTPPSGGIIANILSAPAVWTSADGLTWQRASLGDTANAGQVEVLAAGSGGLVAVGPTPTGITSAVWTSVDGRTWSRLSDPSVLPGGIVSDGTTMVAQVYVTGDRVTFSVSTDGTTWRPLGDSGATDSMPRWPGPAVPTISSVRVTAQGLIVLGWDGSDGTSPIWIVPAISSP